MQDAGVKSFDSLISHIHWVYCAYLLLHEIPGLEIKGIKKRQQWISAQLSIANNRHLFQLTTRIDPISNVKNHLQEAFDDLMAA